MAKVSTISVSIVETLSQMRQLPTVPCQRKEVVARVATQQVLALLPLQVWEAPKNPNDSNILYVVRNIYFLFFLKSLVEVFRL